MCKKLTDPPPPGFYPVPIKDADGRTLCWIVLVEEREGRTVVSYSQLGDNRGHVQRYRGPGAAVKAAQRYHTMQVMAENARLRALSNRTAVAESQPLSVNA